MATIKGTLILNELTPEPNDYRVQVHDVEVLDLEQLMDVMDEDGSLGKRADVLLILTRFFAAIVKVHKRGQTVNIPLFRSMLSVSGVFFKGDLFNRAKHSLNLVLIPGAVLWEAIQGLTVKLTEKTHAVPVISELYDYVTDTKNQFLTAGDDLRITGSNLKVEGTDPEVGVFFVSSNGTKIRATRITHNESFKLIVKIPALSAGTYQILIKTQYIDRKNTKDVRSILSDVVLTVK